MCGDRRRHAGSAGPRSVSTACRHREHTGDVRSCALAADAELARGRSSAARTGSPAAGRAGSARCPGSPRATHGPRRGPGSTRSGPVCRGASVRGTAAATSASSTISPAYITATRSHISATTPRSCVIRMIEVPVSRWSVAHQVQDLRLDRHVERGRGLVGDQQLGLERERHRDHHALRHAARDLVREGLEPALRIGDAHHLEQLRGPRAGRAVLHPAVDLEDLRDLRARRPSPGSATTWAAGRSSRSGRRASGASRRLRA